MSRQGARGGRRQPGPLALLAAPWWGMFRPVAAARLLAAGSRLSFWLACGLHAVLLAAGMVLLALWNATVQTVWVPPASVPATLSTAASVWGTELRRRSLAEVWRDWHAGGPLGSAELAFFLALMLTLLGAVFLAWLNLARVHRSGPVWPAFCHTFRAVTVGWGLLTVLVLGLPAAMIWMDHATQLGVGYPDIVEVVALLALPGGLALLLFVTGRAAAGLGRASAEPVLHPRCEGCGYDLTYQPPRGRCPECGRPVVASLALAGRRGCPWERTRRPGLAEWFDTAQQVVLRPGEFYRRLRLRTSPDAAARFAAWNYVLIGLTAAAGLSLLRLARPSDLAFFLSDWAETAVAAAAVGLVAPLLCWLEHRLGAATVLSWWLARRALPDTRWAAKVIAYESAWQWTFCLFWAVLVASFAFGGAWITGLLSIVLSRPLVGAPGELLALLVGSMGLSVAGLWRYAVVLRAIRWANH